MIYSSLAVFALSASAMLNPINPPYIHRAPDTRISVKLYNRGAEQRQVAIDGQVYTVRPHKTLSIKTEKGTLAYADNRNSGDSLIVEVTPDLNHAKIDIN